MVRFASIEQPPRRVYFVDVARGIGILLVVLGHTKLPEVVSSFIYSFHVPFFFFLSGFVLQGRIEEAWPAFIWKRVRTLIWPYVIFSILAAIVIGVFSNDRWHFVWNSISDSMSFEKSLDTPLWFLLALFSSAVLYKMISVFPRVLIGLASFFMYIASVVIDKHLALDLPLRPISALHYVLFLYLGHSAIFYRLDLCGITFSLKRILRIILCFTLLAVFAVIRLRTDWVISSAAFLLTSVCGTMMIIDISIFLAKWQSFSAWISWCGRNSLGILCVHEIIMFVKPLPLTQGVVQIRF